MRTDVMTMMLWYECARSEKCEVLSCNMRKTRRDGRIVLMVALGKGKARGV